ncbi:MAG: RNA ligase partner protein [Nitrospira sp.]|nr:RNA ligase partner protein [Nitrospira sp.]
MDSEKDKEFKFTLEEKADLSRSVETDKSSSGSEWTLHPQRVVLDTSLFVNPDVRKSLGDTPTEAFEAFLFLAAQIHILEFYMPPSIFEELLHFVEKDKIPEDLLLILHQKPPKKHELRCPAFLLYELIEDIRERVNKGLRIAEKAVRDIEKKGSDEIIQDLRRKYREALREGIIDSKEDVDLLLLAMELDALLITADQGLIKWAEKLGTKWLFPEKFKDYLNEILHRERILAFGIVSDVMTREVISVKKDASIKEVVALLSEHRISGVPVVDDRHHVLGIITEADIVSKSGEWVMDVMTFPVITISPDTDIREAARVLSEKKIKRLPVIDSHNKLIGIISRADIMKAVGK